MVHEANVKQAAAEKQLKEAQGKVGGLMMEPKGSRETILLPSRCSCKCDPSTPVQIDVLQAEVTALKALVLTSTPSSPNRQLHPQLQSPGTRGAYKLGHSRNKSTSSALPSSLGKPEPPSVPVQPAAKEEREVEPEVKPVPALRRRPVSSCFAPVFPTSLPFSALSALTSPPQPALPLSLCCLLLSQPAAVPALLSLILCLVPGQSLRLSFDQFWQQRREGLERGGRQVTASVRPGFMRFAVVSP